MYPRHTLIEITLSGRRRILHDAVSRGFVAADCGQLLLPEEYSSAPEAAWTGQGVRPAVPGIVRREENAPRADMLPVGFVSWTCGDAGRLRLGSFVQPDEILAAHSPYDVLNNAKKHPDALLSRTPALCAAMHLKAHASALRVRPGIWGSAALELYTGYAYTHTGSDLDLLLCAETAVDEDTVAEWLGLVLETEQRFGLRIDPELDLPSGYGVSLKEFSARGGTVLGKGRHDVRLLTKDQVRAELAKGGRLVS